MTAADANIGALELGILFSTLLYGVVTLLVYLYLKSDFKDTLGLRVTVCRHCYYYIPALSIVQLLFFRLASFGKHIRMPALWNYVCFLTQGVRALETTQMALTWGILYVTTVTKSEDPFMTGERGEKGVWPLAVVIPTTALVGTTVQVRSVMVKLEGVTFQ